MQTHRKKQTVIQKRLQSVEAIDHLSLTSAELEKVPPSSPASSTTILSSTFPMILTPLSTCLKASSFNYARQALLPELYRELAPGVIYPLLDLDIRPCYLIFSWPALCFDLLISLPLLSPHISLFLRGSLEVSDYSENKLRGFVGVRGGADALLY